MSTMKYVRFENAGIIIVESHIKHSEIKSPYYNDTAISAGFFNIQDAQDADLYGESVSLKLSSKEGDVKRLRRNLRGW